MARRRAAASDAPDPPPHRPARAWTAPSVEVGGPAHVHAGLDGESLDLTPPLRCVIRPAALRVRISSHHPGVSPAARIARYGL